MRRIQVWHGVITSILEKTCETSCSTSTDGAQRLGQIPTRGLHIGAPAGRQHHELGHHHEGTRLYGMGTLYLRRRNVSVRCRVVHSTPSPFGCDTMLLDVLLLQK